MKERVFGHPISSVIGMVIIAVCVAAFFLDKATWPQFTGGLAIGIGLIVSKDKIPFIGK